MAPSRDPVKFVLFFNGRSGSSMLVEALDSHPQVVARGEILSGKDEDSQLETVRRFLTRPRRRRITAAGFKTKLKDVEEPEGLAGLLREVDASIILLQRHNVVKQVVSRDSARRLHEATSDWNLYDEKDRPPPAAIDPAWFDVALMRLERHKRRIEKYVERLNLPTLSLYYEDFLVDWQASLAKTCSFLGVEPGPIYRQTVKNTSDDLREAISNFEELKALYADTPYEPMFDEVLVPSSTAT